MPRFVMALEVIPSSDVSIIPTHERGNLSKFQF